MADGVIRLEEYSLLKDFKVEVEAAEDGFSLCFWVYLSNSTAFPATIIRQVGADVSKNAPFLVLNETKALMLLPLTSLHKEATDLENMNLLAEVPKVSIQIVFPLEKWVHVGCEVSTDFVRLYIDGEIAGEQTFSSLFNEDCKSNGLTKITFLGTRGNDDNILGYIHGAKVLPSGFSIKDHHDKNQPLQLSIDNSSASDIEEDSDGVWSIVGGKASCRRIFSLDVLLLHALGQPVKSDMEVAASLLYVDDGSPVEKTTDEEAPLLASYDGIEYDSCRKPSKFLHGRASFKLKISQLSSKCDNRLFCIKFRILKNEGYQFLEAFSHPIRCISRNRNPKASTIVSKKTSAIHPLSGSQSFGLDVGSLEFGHNTVQEAKHSPSSKRVRLGESKASTMNQPDEECDSHAFTANQVENGLGSSLEGRTETCVEADNSLCDSESSEAREPASNSMSSGRHSITDFTIFQYCLGGLSERSLLLKEIVPTASDEEISVFADKVSLYSECSHHRHQIKMAKRLIEEGTKAWNLISLNKQQVQWESAIFDIEEHFMKIACCGTRSLTQQDFELLRKIAGCQDYLDQENFEKMWCWLYPIALTLSRNSINTIWSSTSPKWIEGFVTKEEAELSLQGQRGLQEPGTFILRFPTSRSWPHPDAGSLIVTYVGRDYHLHNRLLSLDYVYSSDEREKNMKPLQEVLLDEPELSRLGRIIRSH